MSQDSTQSLKVTMEEKSQILKFHEQYKNDLATIPQNVKDILQSLNNKLWDIKKSDKAEYQEKVTAFELIEKIHFLLNKKFDQSWKPKEPKAGGTNKSWTASNEQRIQNCNALKAYLDSPNMQIWNYLSAFEQAQILAKVWGSVKQ